MAAPHTPCPADRWQMRVHCPTAQHQSQSSASSLLRHEENRGSNHSSQYGTATSSTSAESTASTVALHMWPCADSKPQPHSALPASKPCKINDSATRRAALANFIAIALLYIMAWSAMAAQCVHMWCLASACQALTLKLVVVRLWDSCVGLVAASWTHTLIPSTAHHTTEPFSSMA